MISKLRENHFYFILYNEKYPLDPLEALTSIFCGRRFVIEVGIHLISCFILTKLLFESLFTFTEIFK